MIGLGTYAYFWQHSSEVPQPLGLIDAFEDTVRFGVGLFQICDYAPLEEMPDAGIAESATAARRLGLTIQLGTKGLDTARLTRYLGFADTFESTLVRTMINGPDSQPDLSTARELLRRVLPSYEAAGVTLVLETYEQLSTADLVALIEDIGSPALGVCLDPANVVARMERPGDCVERTAKYVRNVHAKDFAFSRRSGWVGFTLAGAAMGTGLHDYPHLLRTVRPRERGIDEVVEHWLPWQGDPATTVRTEREWTRAAIEYLRSTP
jgi:3-oxoisoapionate decarboxylase